MSAPVLRRWRLVLGKSSADSLDSIGGCTADDLGRDAALDWLYERDPSLGERDIRNADLSESALSVPTWIDSVHRLFPEETIERLERDAVEEFGLHEVVTNKEVLERIEPSETLLRAVLLTKHLMNDEVLALARELVRKVVQQLVEALAKQVRSAFSGARARRRSRHRSIRNFDALGTVRANLRHYDREQKRLAIREPLFWSRSKRHGEQWQVIVVVDQSGSMVSSVIHAAVTASCLWGLPAIKTHLVAFDTNVIDLTGQVTDPVETLMKVQLGGGTDIAKAVQYAEGLIENPARTVVVLITDLYEGGDADALVRSVKRQTTSGVRFVTLAALDNRAAPVYDKELGARLVKVGASVGAMTPNQLVGFLKDVLK
ncbi:MAG: VWA domain-containing protein [Acidobacteriota bacterium]